MARASQNTVTLLVPGLLGPMPGWLQSSDTPRFPQLERWLGRADAEAVPGSDLSSTLCSLFGVERRPEGDLPVAALSRAGEGAAADGRCWIQVEPVCLRPDQSRLLLFDTLDFGFTLAEAEALGELFMAHFQDRDWILEVTSPQRWYLGVESVPALQTHPLGEVFGRNMDLFLPRGGERLAWHGVLNEVQMLFFDADVNRRREAAGRMPVNGLWFSGIGPLPGQVAAPFDRVCSDEPLARGLGIAAGIPQGALSPDRAPPMAADHRLLLVDSRLQRPVWSADPQAWAEGLNRFQSWLGGWVEGVRHGAITELCIYPCDGSRRCLSRRTLRRFWRRTGELLQLSQGAA